VLCFAGTPGYTSAFNLCCLYSYISQRVCTSAAYPQHVPHFIHSACSCSSFNLCCLYSYVFQRVCTSAAYPQHVPHSIHSACPCTSFNLCCLYSYVSQRSAPLQPTHSMSAFHTFCLFLHHRTQRPSPS